MMLRTPQSVVGENVASVGLNLSLLSVVERFAGLVLMKDSDTKDREENVAAAQKHLSAIGRIPMRRKLVM